jgi:hypothetical protein
MKKEYFPIKQRSPWVSTLLVIMVLIYEWTYYIYLVHPENDKFLYSNGLTAFLYVIKFGYLYVFLMRCSRLGYAFTKMKNKYITSFMKK